MEKSDVLYMKGMNGTESDDDVEEDIWDDRKLNEAYDKALKMANLEVAKRVAMATNSANSKKNKPGEATQPQSNQEQNDKLKKAKINKTPKKVLKKELTHIWKEGMLCRAMYSVDGFDYEAIVLTIIDEENCIIRYLGYDNTEIVPISSLQPSLGKQARKDQMIDALVESEREESLKRSNLMDNDLSDGAHLREFEVIPPLNKCRPARNKRAGLNRGLPMPNIPMPDMSMLKDFAQMDMPAPPPPLVGMHAASFNDDQALSNMLVSWYMSGYYTGLYHGMKRTGQRHRDC